jgi:hypothetical protein
LDWFPDECYWSGLGEASSGTLQYYRSAFGIIYGDSPLAQPPLKFFDVGLQVTDEQRRLMARGYDCRVIRVEG